MADCGNNRICKVILDSNVEAIARSIKEFKDGAGIDETFDKPFNFR